MLAEFEGVTFESLVDKVDNLVLRWSGWWLDPKTSVPFL